MLYILLVLLSLFFGYKIGILVQFMKVSALKNQITAENIEDRLRKEYDKKILKYEKKINALETRLIDKTFSDEVI